MIESSIQIFLIKHKMISILIKMLFHYSLYKNKTTKFELFKSNKVVFSSAILIDMNNLHKLVVHNMA
ncbi:hypothetical protein PFBG_03212 [Plasmodium falciparum 7G8]|uniref:Uncharacterized protein n=1 Tax=Plasmodium falciparum (isolate 7G8) TaxID=57266 RepID=W7EZT4_PLAF8|nr:hypothetical protein PFBG_03212 [Plasmodium falciparum 7G8]